VRIYVEEKYGKEMLYKGGLKIYTTINAKMQQAAQKAVWVFKLIEELAKEGI
jgi:penicillin-binding protein 1A